MSNSKPIAPPADELNQATSYETSLEFRDSEDEEVTPKSTSKNELVRRLISIDIDDEREEEMSNVSSQTVLPPAITSPQSIPSPIQYNQAQESTPVVVDNPRHVNSEIPRSMYNYDRPSNAPTTRESSCSTFFMGDETHSTIDVTWMGESLGLEMQRLKSKNNQTIDIVWKDGSVGITFGIEQATRQVVVKRTSRRENDVASGYILISANGRPVVEGNFDSTMRDLKLGHDAGRSQLLQFTPPPAAPLVKSVDPRSVLARAGVNHSYELKSINGLQTRYMPLDLISSTLRDAVKPCLLHFALCSEAFELQQLQETAANARNQSGATLAAAAIIAAVCI